MTGCGGGVFTYQYVRSNQSTLPGKEKTALAIAKNHPRYLTRAVRIVHDCLNPAEDIGFIIAE